MIEKRTMIVRFYEELKEIKDETSKIVGILQQEQKASSAKKRELGDIARHLLDKHYELLRCCSSNISGLLIDLHMRRVDYKKALHIFKEFLKQINDVLSFFNSEAIEQVKAETSK